MEQKGEVRAHTSQFVVLLEIYSEMSQKEIEINAKKDTKPLPFSLDTVMTM